MVSADRVLHKKPIVEVALPDIEDGETNLLPVSATLRDLKVTFEMWTDSYPELNPETLTLFWDGGYLAEKTWYAPIDPDDLFLMVPQSRLGEGEHVIYYNVAIFNGENLDSEPLTITIDKTRPLLNLNEQLLFPPDIISGGVTDQYLEDNGEVLAEIPEYREIKPGDILTWFWDRSPSSREEVAYKTLSADDIGKPLTISFGEDMIRRRDDGDRYAYYRIEDRAGNPSDYALPVTLKVAATPVSRDYPWPDIDKSQGSNQLVELVPEAVALGATVIVQDVEMKPGEVLWVQWGEPGELGAYRTSTPTSGDNHRYAIPSEHIGPHIGAQLPVRYEAVGAGGTFPSQVRLVAVQKLNTDQLPTIRCEGVLGGDLSLKRIPDSGVPLTLETWTLMATTQRVRIDVTGINAASQPVQRTVLNNHAVTAMELINGIKATAPKTFMAELKLDNKFSLKVYVSFDEGKTWPPLFAPNFPINDEIRLIA